MLIDKDALVAEIESLRRTTFTNFDEGVNATVQTLIEVVDTLEVKEAEDESYIMGKTSSYTTSTKYRKKNKVMKSYTDISQSKKLAEILPLESADMHYARIEDDDEMRDWTVYLSPIPKICALYVENLPCWSLAALLDILPKVHKLKPILDLEECSIQYSGIDLYVVADNPVDACYEMIIKLHEQKLL